MRFARTTGLLLALLLLVRCGAPEFRVSAPEAESLVAHERVPVVATEIAQAPMPRQIVRAVHGTVDKGAELEWPSTASVRDLVGGLGIPKCGSGCRHVFDTTTGEWVPEEPLQITELKRRGEEAYADYEIILTDPDSSSEEILGTCWIIEKLPRDHRTRFVPALMRRLDSPDALVPGGRNADFTRRLIRCAVIGALADIRDERAVGVLVRVMNEDDLGSAYHAVRLLAKLGGPRELDALNAWLAGQDISLLGVRQMCKMRDEFDSRLKAKARKPVVFGVRLP